VATTAVTMQRRLSASWAEAPPRSPQGSLNAPSGVGQFAPVRLGREDARTRQRERNEQRSHRADGPTVSRCARPVGVSKRQQN
jgi:hypothetical protein